MKKDRKMGLKKKEKWGEDRREGGREGKKLERSKVWVMLSKDAKVKLSTAFICPSVLREI